MCAVTYKSLSTKMLNDYTLLILARDRQEQVRNDVARCRHAATMLTHAALLTAFFTTALVAACSGDRRGTFSGAVVDAGAVPLTRAIRAGGGGLFRVVRRR